MPLNCPGASTGPPTNQVEGQPAQPVNLDQWRAVCALAAEHLLQGLSHIVSSLAANRFKRTPDLGLPPEQDDDARGQRGRPGEQQPSLPTQQVCALH